MKHLKRLLCALLCVALCATGAISAAAAPRPAYGDAYYDGEINMKDVLTLRGYLAETIWNIWLLYADANADGAVNTKDVLLLRKYLAGFDVTFGEFAKPIDLPLCAGKDAAVTLYDVNPDGKYGYELNLGAENLTTDRTIEVVVLGIAVNDVMQTPSWSVVLEPGESLVDTAYVEFDVELDEDIQKVSLFALALDCDTGEFLDVGTQPPEFFLSGDAESYEKKDRAPSDGSVLVDNSEILAMVSGVEKSLPDLLTWINVYVENRTQTPLFYICDGAKVNGQEVESLLLALMLPQASQHNGIMFSLRELEEKGIETVETAEFSIDVYTFEGLNSENPFPLHSYNVKYVKP